MKARSGMGANRLSWPDAVTGRRFLRSAQIAFALSKSLSTRPIGALVYT